jgi:O-acetylserine/cysteine efflux transporter
MFAILFSWAFNAVAIKWGVEEAPPLLLTSLRFLVVAIVLVPFTRITWKQIPLIIKISVSFGLMHFSMFFVGMTYTDAGTAAMVVQLGTPFAMFGAVIFLKERISIVNISGLVLSLAGMVVLSGSPTLSSFKGIAILLVSAMGWAITNILIKGDKTLSTYAMTGWMSLFSLPLTSGMSLYLEKNQLTDIYNSSWHLWFSLIYSALICSVLSYSLWYWLLRKYEVNKIVPFTLLSPVIAVFLGIIINGDGLNEFKAMGSLMIIGGAFIAIIPVSTERGSGPD